METPAWAGEPPTTVAVTVRRGVYPRVGWCIDGESVEGGDEGGDSEDGFACPALKRLLTDAQSPDDRCFDTVLLYKMSKLSRQIAEAHVIKRKLGASGVTVVSMTEPTSAEWGLELRGFRDWNLIPTLLRETREAEL